MYFADLHIHSKYSRATSRDCDARHLDLWARRKGVALVGTGDFTHPAWRAELAESLERASDGLYRLREELRLPCECAGEARFAVTGEISTIYKKHGKTRKIHSLIVLPGLEAAETLAKRLEAVGNIRSDGRPILGLDCRDLLEMTLEACPEAVFIPAHIWTPHFSLFGAFSGFDTVEECFGDLTKHIHALETGLSSDPPMNRCVSALDGYTLVSNSDAHSPAKLAREANMLAGPLSYVALARALTTGEGFAGTLEFFPEEGKYHLDGHRACGVCLSPGETAAHGGKCPVCGKKITVGVLHRVEALADRAEGEQAPETPFESLMPLCEVIAGCTGAAAAGKRTQAAYLALLGALGSELFILREAPLDAIARAAGEAVAEGVRRLRAGKVLRRAGYDGAYGVISLFAPGELAAFSGQLCMPGLPEAGRPQPPRAAAPLEPPPEAAIPGSAPPETLNDAQRMAVEARERAVAVIAGPGTGKTRTLVERIAHLIEARGVKPSHITAITFTNQAAEEMRARLTARLGGKAGVRGLTVGTFHAVCLRLLPEKPLLAESTLLDLARGFLRERSVDMPPRDFLARVSREKNGAPGGERLDGALLSAWNGLLNAQGARDLDDLLCEALALDVSQKAMFTHLLVDEFQDLSAVQRALALHFSASGSLFVIGDPDQSIYGFRGADANCFERLRDALPGLRTITLTENYRSTLEILAASLDAISRNPGGARTLHANRPAGAPVRLLTARDAFSEGVFIAREIARLTGGLDMLAAGTLGAARGERAFSDIAVLCRTRRQLSQIESCLRHDDIPCVIAGREDYLLDDAVRGALAFFTFLLNMRDLSALRECLRLRYACPEAEIERLLPRVRALDEPTPGALCAALGALGTGALLAQDARAWFSRAQKEKPHKLLAQYAAERGGGAALERLAAASVFSANMREFLNNLLTGQEGDVRRAAGRSAASGAVRLMTLHGAKGLEFPVVFLAGVSEGALPLTREGLDTDPCEERRLFFVGMTRAREELTITCPGEPSAFARELPAAVSRAVLPARRRAAGTQLSLF